MVQRINAKREVLADADIMKKAFEEVNLAQIMLRSGKPEEELKDIMKKHSGAEFEAQRRQVDGVKELAYPESFLSSLVNYNPPQKKESDPLVVLIVGAPGVGKSTIVGDYVKAHPDSESIHMGSEIMSRALSQGLLSEHGMRFSKLSWKTKNALKDEAVKGVANRMVDCGVYLVDSHNVTGAEGVGLVYSVTPHFMKTLKPDLMVLVTANSTDVLERRRQDKTRHRGTKEELIANHLMAERAVTELVSESARLPVIAIENPTGGGKDALEKLQEAIEEVKAQRRKA